MYTTSSAFLKTLADASITHAFVNWGSDHPALLEDLERQRIENGEACPKIITCPNEMVALSCAQGYAQITGKPAAVFIHVDVGTQALGGAVHNVDRNRVPVLIYAGAAPYTLNGELPGSRNEFIFWLQDSLDQPAIVRQYMRMTTQINSGKNVNHVVMRALQAARSDPPGPVYVWARREVMEQPLSESDFSAISVRQNHWPPIQPATITPETASTIGEALVNAKRPYIVTSYLGRNPKAVPLLIELSECLGIPVYLSCPSSVSFPLDHPHFAGISYGMGENKWLREADVILILDSDIPWIPMNNTPHQDARIFHIDVDVLKQNMGMFHVDAELIAKADCEQALTTILKAIDHTTIVGSVVADRKKSLATQHELWIQDLDRLETPGTPNITVPYVIRVLRDLAPPKTLYLNEGISNYIPVWSHLRPSRIGSSYTSGASSLGWGLGAAIGAIIGNAAIPGSTENEFVALVVGDGSFLFGVPSSAYWIARRYDTPFLTIVLNNGGWRSPKLSMLGVHPTGMGSRATSSHLNVTFGPESPDYSQIAVAAGKAWGKKITHPSEVEGAIREAIAVVQNERRCAVLDVVLEGL